mmetsp:Transcript_5523/g.9940  ORF Transcript_5523/g.9940 Transcript_5523/m.9940 type:complete len:149 (+) Transcript_5523:49-495(+)
MLVAYGDSSSDDEPSTNTGPVPSFSREGPSGDVRAALEEPDDGLIRAGGKSPTNTKSKLPSFGEPIKPVKRARVELLPHNGTVELSSSSTAYAFPPGETVGVPNKPKSTLLPPQLNKRRSNISTEDHAKWSTHATMKKFSEQYGVDQG